MCFSNFLFINDRKNIDRKEFAEWSKLIMDLMKDII